MPAGLVKHGHTEDGTAVWHFHVEGVASPAHIYEFATNCAIIFEGRRMRAQGGLLEAMAVALHLITTVVRRRNEPDV